MSQILNIAAGLCGIVGGILWFLAAAHTPTPAQGSYSDVVDSPTSLFARAWKKGTRLNQVAAIMTGMSSLMFGAAVFF